MVLFSVLKVILQRLVPGAGRERLYSILLGVKNMTEEQVQRMVEELSLKHFNVPFLHKAYFTGRPLYNRISRAFVNENPSHSYEWLGLILFSEGSEEGDQVAQNLYVFGVDGFHGAVFGLQTDSVFLVIDALYGGFVFNHSNNDIAIFGVVLLSDDNDVAVKNACFDHAFALYAKGKHVALAQEVLGHYKIVLDVFRGENGLAGGNFANQGHGFAAGEGSIHEFQSAGLSGIPADEAFFLQSSEMGMHGGRGAQAHRVADFPDRWGIALYFQFGTYELQYGILLFARSHRKLLLSFIISNIISHILSKCKRLFGVFQNFCSKIFFLQIRALWDRII